MKSLSRKYAEEFAYLGGVFYITQPAPKIIKDRFLDILKETVVEAKQKGITFSELEPHFKKISKGAYKFEEDIYAKKLKRLFEGRSRAAKNK